MLRAALAKRLSYYGTRIKIMENERKAKKRKSKKSLPVSLRAMEKENCKRGEKKGIERVCKRKRVEK